MNLRSRRRACLALGLLGSLALPGAAYAGNSVTASVSEAVRSVTVSGTALTLNNCFNTPGAANSLRSAALTIPNGLCFDSAFGNQFGTYNQTGSTFDITNPSPTFAGTGTAPVTAYPITVTNGAVGGHIDVQASAQTASGDWSVCIPGAAACTGTGHAPGSDQYAAYTLGSTGTSDQTQASAAGSTPGCDKAFAARDCVANANQQGSEGLAIVAPSGLVNHPSATGQSFTMTWTAVP